MVAAVGSMLFRPMGLVSGLLAGMIARTVFNFIWARIDDEEAPEATHREASWRLLLIAAALRGLVYGLAREAVDRGSRQAYFSLTGTWPGEQERDPA